MAGDPISEIQRSYLVNLAKEGRRWDNRKFDEYRPTTIETGIIKQADGSARVTLGNTQVYAGVKMLLGKPFPDTPDSGVLMTNAELVPMAAPEFEPGPPRPPAIEVGRVIDRGIREGKTIDLGKLCIDPGEKVWMTYLDLHVVDYDGNLFDAGTLAFMAALLTTNVPWQKVDKGDPKPLQVDHTPLMTTAVKIGGEILFDPTGLEERVAEPRISLSTDENGDIRAGQKGLAGGLTIEEVKTVMKGSRSKAAELRTLLLEHVKRANR